MPGYDIQYKDGFNITEYIWLLISKNKNKKIPGFETQVWFFLLFKLSFLTPKSDIFKT